MDRSLTETRIVGVIPARGGSKGIPGKNLKKVGGVSLIGRAISSVAAAVGLKATYVTTDSPDIAKEAGLHGAAVIDRPASIADDQASSEDALLHALQVLEVRGVRPEILVFAQCTSPFVDPSDIAEGIRLVSRGKFDCAFSVKQTHAFHWRMGSDGRAVGVNHDYRKPRRRRQDLPKEYKETGAFYVLNVPMFLNQKHRFFGKIGLIETSQPEIEIDQVEDLNVAIALTKNVSKKGSPDLSAIKALIMDFDGVHTDDTVLVLPDGTEAVVCSRRDGLGLERLRKSGVKTLILSKERNAIVQRRAEKLNIPCLHAVDNKVDALSNWLAAQHLTWQQVAFVGNDVNDLGCMRKAGISLCPADSHREAVAESDWVLDARGGRGAIREVCDMFETSQ